MQSLQSAVATALFLSCLGLTEALSINASTSANSTNATSNLAQPLNPLSRPNFQLEPADAGHIPPLPALKQIHPLQQFHCYLTSLVYFYELDTMQPFIRPLMIDDPDFGVRLTFSRPVEPAIPYFASKQAASAIYQIIEERLDSNQAISEIWKARNYVLKRDGRAFGLITQASVGNVEAPAPVDSSSINSSITAVVRRQIAADDPLKASSPTSVRNASNTTTNTSLLIDTTTENISITIRELPTSRPLSPISIASGIFTLFTRFVSRPAANSAFEICPLHETMHINITPSIHLIFRLKRNRASFRPSNGDVVTALLQLVRELAKMTERIGEGGVRGFHADFEDGKTMAGAWAILRLARSMDPWPSDGGGI